MTKVLVTGDLHINHKPYPDSLERSMTMLYDLTKVAKLRECHHIILNGDVFENHNPAWDTVIQFTAWLRHTAESGIWVEINTGNHDYSSLVKPEMTPLLVLRQPKHNLTKIHVTSESYRKLLLARACFWIVPWRPGKVFKHWMASMVPNLMKSIPNILVCHQPITEGVVNAEGTTVNQDLSLKDLHADKFDWVIMHDYHEHQFLAENVFYGGSPMTTKFGDKNQVGVWIYDSQDNSFEPHDLPTVVPRHVTWTVTEKNLHIPHYEPINYNRIKCPSHLREEVIALYPGCYPVCHSSLKADEDETSSRLSGVEEGDLVGTIEAFLDSKIFEKRTHRTVYCKLMHHYLKQAGALGEVAKKKKKRRKKR